MTLLLLHFRWFCRYEAKKVAKSIPTKDLNAHGYLTGSTGSGKSNLMLQWIYGQWYLTRKTKDCGIVFIDPHGDASQLIKKFDLNRKYGDSLVYVDYSLMKGYTPTLNPLECRETDPELIEIQAQQLVRAFEEMLQDTKLTNYMRAVLKPCIYVLLTLHDCNLRDLQTFLRGDNSRFIQTGKQCAIQAYREFFESEFSNPHYDRTKSSIYTKIQSLLNTQAFYYMTYGTSTIDLERLTRQGKIIVFNLCKGKMGEEASETLGKFIIAKLKGIAFQRAGIPPERRKSLYLLVDEADTFIRGGQGISTILKESRKYGLHLLLATQNLISGKEQESLRRNVLNNTNVKIVGINGITSLKPLSQEIGVHIDELQALKPHSFYYATSAHKKIIIKTKNIFGYNSPLLLQRGEVMSQTHRMAKKSGYYKPIQQYTPLPEERIEDFPESMRSSILQKNYPLPKFTC